MSVKFVTLILANLGISQFDWLPPCGKLPPQVAVAVLRGSSTQHARDMAKSPSGFRSQEKNFGRARTLKSFAPRKIAPCSPAATLPSGLRNRASRAGQALGR
jgi:hypothetical protein